MSSTFWTTVEALESLSTMGRLNQWKTKKELEDRYGKDELEILLQDGSFLVRANPLNPKLRLYLDRTDTMSTSLNKSTKWSASGTTKTDKQQHMSLMEAFRSADLDEDMLEKVHLGLYDDQGPDMGAVVEDKFDTATVASLPPALKRKLAGGKAQEPGQGSAQEPGQGSGQGSGQGNGQGQGPGQKQQKVDLVGKMLEDFQADEEVDWSKVSKFQSLVSKGKQSISSLLFSIKGQEMKPDKVTLNKCNKAVQEMQDMYNKLDTLICQKNATKKHVETCLTKVAQLYKEGQHLNALLGAFVKRDGSSKRAVAG